MTLIPYAGYSHGTHRKAGAGAKPKPAKPIDPAYPKGKRGFAAMSPEKQRELAAKGGAALRPEQRTYSTNRELASEAGRKGAAAPRDPKTRSFNDRALASAAGKKGAIASNAAKAAKKEQGA